MEITMLCINNTEKAVEMRLRRKVKAEGFALCKSRGRTHNADNYGGYRILDPNLNTIETGQRFDLSLEDVEAWLKGS